MGRCSVSKSCGTAAAGGDAACGDLAGGDAAAGGVDDPSAMTTKVRRAWNHQFIAKYARIKEV